MAASTVMDASYDRKRYVREPACAICQTFKGQPHKVHCLEPGVVFVSYEGNPDITPIAEHDA